MRPTSSKKGSCLCGSVTLKVQIESETFDVCHCSMCRKWGGGPAFTVDVGPTDSPFINKFS